MFIWKWNTSFYSLAAEHHHNLVSNHYSPDEGDVRWSCGWLHTEVVVLLQNGCSSHYYRVLMQSNFVDAPNIVTTASNCQIPQL